MPPSVTILGECMVELSPTQTPDTMRVGFAGDTFNTAWYLARLWGDAGRVRYATRVGQDETSAAFRAFAEAAGIDTDHVGTHPARGMGLYMIHLKDGERSFSYWRDTSAARTLAEEPERVTGALQASDTVYLSGITVAILPPEGRDTLAAALGRARDAGRRVFYDTNLRPRLWGSAEEMRRETERFARCADVVLPSFEDEATHFGHASPDATAAHYRSLGAEMVVVKNAGQDVALAHPEGTERIALESVASPLDTTAAGDSFNAGFLAEILRSGDATAAVHSGAALARRVIMGPGALVKAALAP